MELEECSSTYIVHLHVHVTGFTRPASFLLIVHVGHNSAGPCYVLVSTGAYV